MHKSFNTKIIWLIAGILVVTIGLVAHGVLSSRVKRHDVSANRRTTALGYIVPLYAQLSKPVAGLQPYKTTGVKTACDIYNPTLFKSSQHACFTTAGIIMTAKSAPDYAGLQTYLNAVVGTHTVSAANSSSSTFPISDIEATMNDPQEFGSTSWDATYYLHDTEKPFEKIEWHKNDFGLELQVDIYSPKYVAELASHEQDATSTKQDTEIFDGMQAHEVTGNYVYTIKLHQDYDLCSGFLLDCSRGLAR